ncbi:type II secretion system F family protein [Salinithrix halophila]|uniref:Type II secretion system F family protein n=1 Tax=Salinithrix halophila TaxID=1485204 RepID=A0ABV8JCH5_9BACL
MKSRWNHDRIVPLSQHLANLLEAGFPLLPSVRLLGEQGILKKGEADRITEGLDEGKNLPDALAEEGLPLLFVSFLQAAEEHGDYAFGLRQGESYYREQGKLVRDMIQALTYPAVVLVLVGFAFFFLVTTVVPRFTEMYETMGLTLPLYTQLFLSFYSIVRGGFYMAGAAILLGALIFLILRRLPPGERSRWMAWWYRLPLVRSYFALRFTHYLSVQLGSLLRSGVPLLKAVEMVECFSPWYPLAKGVHRVKERLLGGEFFHKSLAKEGNLFLPSLKQLVALGEEAGRLDQSLLTLARGTEMMIRERMQRFTRSLEPLLIFGIGVVMTGTVLAMFLPMLHLVRAI